MDGVVDEDHVFEFSVANDSEILEVEAFEDVDAVLSVKQFTYSIVCSEVEVVEEGLSV